MRNKTSHFSILAGEQNFVGLTRINRDLIAKVEAVASPQRVVLDMDSTEIPVDGQQENSAHKGHFESTCYYPLLLFNREGDCLATKLRPGSGALLQQERHRRVVDLASAPMKCGCG